MAVKIILKNSKVEFKNATADQLEFGELGLNYNESGPYLQCKDADEEIVQLGGVYINTTAPKNPIPGKWWLNDTALSLWDGTRWVTLMASGGTIGNGKLTIKDVDGKELGTFTANQETDTNITIPAGFTGDYDDLTNKPDINDGELEIETADGTSLGTFSANQKNNATITLPATSSFSGDYNDLTNKPTIGDGKLTINNSDGSEAGTFTANQTGASIVTLPAGFSGDYDDLTNKPTIPTVGNAKIILKQGGTEKGSFTTNQSGSDVSIDLDAGGGATGNFVTLDTEQTITARKTWNETQTLNKSGSYTDPTIKFPNNMQLFTKRNDDPDPRLASMDISISRQNEKNGMYITFIDGESCFGSYCRDTRGNVALGIRTNNPEYALDVVGKIRGSQLIVNKTLDTDTSEWETNNNQRHKITWNTWTPLFDEQNSLMDEYRIEHAHQVKFRHLFLDASLSKKQNYALKLKMDDINPSQGHIKLEGNGGGDVYLGWKDDALRCGYKGSLWIRFPSADTSVGMAFYWLKGGRGSTNERGNQPNIFVDNSGNIFRSTYSGFRRDSGYPETALTGEFTDFNVTVDQLNPIAYRNNNTDYIGWDVDELAAIDPRLVDYDYADEAFNPDDIDPETGHPNYYPDAVEVPQSPRVDSLLAVYAVLFKQAKTKITTLETQVADLLARVEALENP